MASENHCSQSTTVPGQFVPEVGADGVSYVWIPRFIHSNKAETYVEFELEACTNNTEIKIAAEVFTPTAGDNSIFLKIDDEEKVAFNLGVSVSEWIWSTYKHPFTLTVGKHRLRVLHKEV